MRPFAAAGARQAVPRAIGLQASSPATGRTLSPPVNFVNGTAGGQ